MNQSLRNTLIAGVSAIAFGSLASAAVNTTVQNVPADTSSFATGAKVSNPTGGAVTGLGTEVNQQQQELIQTFVPTSTFTLTQFSLLSGGRAGGSVTLHLYPINTAVTGQGGGNADGFVNTQYSTDLLGGGAGLTVALNGSPGDQVINFAFSGVDQATLTSGVEYGFEVDSTAAGNFSWQRDAGGVYTSGNIYQAASGTTKGQVGGTPDRDGYFAVYGTATPEPGSLALLSLGGLAALRRKRV